LFVFGVEVGGSGGGGGGGGGCVIKNDIEHKIVCVGFFLQLLSETFLILKSIQRVSTTNVHRPSCKVPVFSCQIFNKR